ncbi:hypothetical protein QQF64_032648 [Cirrhinus molitorella]|uniref:Uncharacterized protein n=1 Tax=Cirrhinus molitorella TaxID=172907 RepID=A0ABR3MRM8_9TELE
MNDVLLFASDAVQRRENVGKFPKMAGRKRRLAVVCWAPVGPSLLALSSETMGRFGTMSACPRAAAYTRATDPHE